MLQMPASGRSRLLTAVVAVSLLLLLVGLVLLLPVDRSDSAPQSVTIQPGTGVYGIATLLKEKRLIRSETLFVVYSLVLGQERHLQAGRYVLSRRMSTPTVVWKIARGFAESEDVEVVIPEGYNIWEIDKRLAYWGLIKEGEFASRFYGQEGHFFPDTYRFKKGMTVEAMADKMEKNFLAKAGYVSRDVLIIASMLEKEARKKADMGLVAGVIENRLERGMLLQIDAAVLYGACLKRYIVTKFVQNCDATKMPVATELAMDGDFNTYRRAGLPPQPIANPGAQAIEAARFPTKSDYYYYLSSRDGSRMIFSKTGTEHIQNRAKYLGL